MSAPPAVLRIPDPGRNAHLLQEAGHVRQALNRLSDDFARALRIRPVRHHTTRRRPLLVIPFPSPFGVPAFASRVILFPPRNSASLTVGLPAETAGPRRGFHVPHA